MHNIIYGLEIFVQRLKKSSLVSVIALLFLCVVVAVSTIPTLMHGAEKVGYWRLMVSNGAKYLTR